LPPGNQQSRPSRPRQVSVANLTGRYAMLPPYTWGYLGGAASRALGKPHEVVKDTGDCTTLLDAFVYIKMAFIVLRV
jgi:hypothetical protein